MKLPAADRVVVDESKLRDYLPSPTLSAQCIVLADEASPRFVTAFPVSKP
ncbi:MAG: hypothetical protein ABIP94_18495 [Planctomycetota bacterium]